MKSIRVQLAIKRYQQEADDPSTSEQQRDFLYQEIGRLAVEGYDPSKYQWGETPPPNELCTECYKWGRETYGYFGWVWWRQCDEHCPHSHHSDEAWS